MQLHIVSAAIHLTGLCPVDQTGSMIRSKGDVETAVLSSQYNTFSSVKNDQSLHCTPQCLHECCDHAL